HIDLTIGSQIIYKNRLLMLDILANNHWKRPIYFTGGSFSDEDYLWLKDYLQLDGVAYKLVPIKTPVDKRNPFDMGQINTDKMYNIVMNWDWGNMGDPNLYHDPETRKNSITYRSNLARLAENLLRKRDTARAEKVLDLAMEKMPVDYYDYYTLLEPYISGYYQVNEKEKARALWEKVAKKYQEELDYYSTWGIDRQYRYADEIITDIERYRGLVDILAKYQDEKILREKADEFNSYLRKFRHFYKQDEEMDTSPQAQEELLNENLNSPAAEGDSVPGDSAQ
ncbi:MAG: hypothetical protein WAM00_08210, partial [Salegentibacter sp.]